MTSGTSHQWNALGAWNRRHGARRPMDGGPGLETLEPRLLLTTLFVDNDGDDKLGNGSQDDPFSTIQVAIERASNGDEVHVAAGEYRENLQMRSGIDVLGAGADVTQIIGQARSDGVVRFDDVTDATLSGFLVTTNERSGDAYVWGVSRGIVFDGNTDSTAVLQRSIVRNVNVGMLVRSPAEPVIVNNILVGENGSLEGISIFENTGFLHATPVIVNNVVVGYDTVGINVEAGSGINPELRFNNVFGNARNYMGIEDLTGTDGNISAAPQFVGPDDFHLQAGSANIDAGDPSRGLDPDGTRADIGVHPWDRVETLETTLHVTGPNSVPSLQFHVLTEGTIEAELSWTGTANELSATLLGRDRPELADPSTPYATVQGTSPLRLTYEVTNDDLARGVNWRLVVHDTANIGTADVLATVAVPFNAVLESRFESEKLELRSGEFWPTPQLQQKFLDELAAAEGDGLHAPVSLSRACTCIDQFQLENLGLLTQDYVPGRHAFAFIKKGLDVSDPVIEKIVRAITPLEPQDKIDPDVLVGNYAAFELKENGVPMGVNQVLQPDGSLQLSVLFAKDVSRNQISTILQGILPAGDVDYEPITDQLWDVTMASADVMALASNDNVQWIEAGRSPLLLENDTTRATIGVDTVQNATIDSAANTISYAGVSGAGISIGIHDSGVDEDHADLNVVENVSGAGSHGTHVAGIAAGSGVRSALTDDNGSPNGGTAFQWRGMAPDANVIDWAGLIDADNVLEAITDDSLDVTNHSHAVGTNGNYNTDNQTVDQLIRGGATSNGTAVPPRPKSFSSGNGGGNSSQYGDQFGYFGLTKQMKNAVVVGNWDANANDLWATSSMGPTHDGRIKPDIVAPGSSITSTNTSGGYRSTGGTSMASPVAAGVMALMLEAWQDTYSTPLGTTIDDNPPLPSTLRSILVQTATDIVDNDVRSITHIEIDSDSDSSNGNDGAGRATATVGPDFATGWGLVNAQAAVEIVQDFHLVGDAPVPSRIVQDSVHQNGVIEYAFAVNDPTEDLKVTLAWDDVEAAVQSPVSSPLLINDLDLELWDPSGFVHYPWQLGQTILDMGGNPIADADQTPGTNIQVQIPITPTGDPANQSDYIPANALTGTGAWVAQQGRDHLNNVEQVLVENPQPGNWTLRVSGFDVQAGTAQDYSVVGMPYPDLADIVVATPSKAMLPAFNEDLSFLWSTQNIGTAGTGVDFDYQILLSDDFFFDTGDVVLTDTNQSSLGPLGIGASQNQTSTVQITAANAATLYGAGTTADDLVDNDAFLLIRADSGDDVLEHNETNIGFLQLGRLVDVVMVLDESGSMKNEVQVSTNVDVAKIDLLNDAANLFLDMIRKDFGDQVGEVTFADSADIVFGPGDVLVPITDANLNDAKAALPDLLTAGGQTNIRDGLQTGLDMLTAAGSVDHRRVIIFFSDGKKTVGGDPGDPTFLQQFVDEDVKVYSVGFGTEGVSGNSGIDVDLLQDLTNTSNGFFHVTQSPLELDKFFVNAVAGAVGATVILDPIDQIAPGQTQTVDAYLTTQETLLTFILTWDDPAKNLNLALQTPSGTTISSQNLATFGGNVTSTPGSSYQLLTVRMPITTGPEVDHDGKWQMVISNPGNQTVAYSASVIADSTLEALQPAGGTAVAAGDLITLGTQVTGLHGVAVPYLTTRVTPSVPLVDVGSLLSASALTTADLNAVPLTANGEALTTQARMLTAVQSRYGSANLIPQQAVQPFMLDNQATGQFAGSFNETSVQGGYSFTLDVDGYTLDCQRLTRQVFQTVQVAPQIAVDRTDINVLRPGPNLIDIKVTPFDTGGNRLGPGLSDNVVIDVAAGLKPVGRIVDNFDGTYSRRFQVTDPQTRSSVSVSAMGVALPPLNITGDLPEPKELSRQGAANDRSQLLAVRFDDPVASQISSVALKPSTGGALINLDVMEVIDTRTVQVTVPAGLTAGQYALHLTRNGGLGPAGTRFQVIDAKGRVSPAVSLLTDNLANLLGATDTAAGLMQLGTALHDLKQVPTGTALTAEAKQAAVNQVTNLIAEGQGMVTQNEVSLLSSVVNFATIDSRFVPFGNIFTAAQPSLSVNLGNGVTATFGEVTVEGKTKLHMLPGPEEIPENRRGNLHLTYQIETTSVFDPALQVDVSIAYSDTDYPDDSNLQVLQLENGVWTPKTVNRDPMNNTITARVSSLGQLTVVSGANSVTAQTAQVVGRSIFYNNSYFDRNDPATNSTDDAAIALDKMALLPGQTANFAHYTNYSKGINGIMIDIAGLAQPDALDAASFMFRVGNDDAPGGWATGPVANAVSVRPGAGVQGSDRVTLTWADGAIQGKWLEVTALNTPVTGLEQVDMFYFGNAPGDTGLMPAGNPSTNAQVNITDELGARFNEHNFLNPAPITDRFDFNRDARVNVTDELTARFNPTDFLTALQWINAPANIADEFGTRFNENNFLNPAPIVDPFDFNHNVQVNTWAPIQSATPATADVIASADRQATLPSHDAAYWWSQQETRHSTQQWLSDRLRYTEFDADGDGDGQHHDEGFFSHLAAMSSDQHSLSL